MPIPNDFANHGGGAGDPAERHWSDCAVHNEPAMPAGPCDCGGLNLADDARHGAVAAPEWPEPEEV